MHILVYFSINLVFIWKLLILRERERFPSVTQQQPEPKKGMRTYIFCFLCIIVQMLELIHAWQLDNYPSQIVDVNPGNWFDISFEIVFFLALSRRLLTCVFFCFFVQNRHLFSGWQEFVIYLGCVYTHANAVMRVFRGGAMYTMYTMHMKKSKASSV